MKKILIILALIFIPTLASAQNNGRNPCVYPNLGSLNCIPVTSSTPLPVTNTPSGTQVVSGSIGAIQQGTWTVYTGALSYTNITTNTNTVVKNLGANFGGIVVNTAGATSTATVYDNTTCTGNVIGVFSTVAQTSLVINAAATVGLCVTTAGGTPANITILYR